MFEGGGREAIGVLDAFVASRESVEKTVTVSGSSFFTGVYDSSGKGYKGNAPRSRVAVERSRKAVRKLT